jgi:Ca2+-binding EF-hand superfamily protein
MRIFSNYHAMRRCFAMKSICLISVVIGTAFALLFLNISPFATAGGGGGGMGGGGGFGGGGGGFGGGGGGRGGGGGMMGGMGGGGGFTQPNIQGTTQGTTQKKDPGYRVDPNAQYSSGCVDWTEFQSTIDADKDGYITKDEWDRAFSARDLNGDGRISANELQRIFSRIGGKDFAESGRAQAFERLDANQNGTIERAEWLGNDRSFKRMNANRDSAISREEFLAMNVRWWNDTFENLDYEGKGVITRSEWLDSTDSFDRLDRDRNGVITKSEFYNPR